MNQLNDAHLPQGSPEHCAGRALDSLVVLFDPRVQQDLKGILWGTQEDGVGARAPHPSSFREAAAAEYLLLGHCPFLSLHYLLFILEPDSEAGKPESYSYGNALGLLSPAIPQAPLSYSQKAVSPKHIDPRTSCSNLPAQPPGPVSKPLSGCNFHQLYHPTQEFPGCPGLAALCSHPMPSTPRTIC